MDTPQLTHCGVSIFQVPNIHNLTSNPQYRVKTHP